MKPDRIPFKLELDGLSNALVNISFNSVYQSNYIVDNVIGLLDQSEEFDSLQIIPSKDADGILVANSKYRFQLNQNVISFNFVSRYLGWSDYKLFITKLLTQLEKFVGFEKTAIRYISGFENISLFSNLDGYIKLNQLPPFYGTEFHFGFQIQDGAYHDVSDVRITDKLAIQNDKSMSVMDITMTSTKTCGSLDEVLSQLEFLHKHEKNVFFLLLKEDFVNKLGPTYE